MGIATGVAHQHLGLKAIQPWREPWCTHPFQLWYDLHEHSSFKMYHKRQNATSCCGVPYFFWPLGTCRRWTKAETTFLTHGHCMYPMNEILTG